MSTSETWGAYTAKVTIAGIVMVGAAFIGNKLAMATPGEPVRDALTVSGVLRGVSGAATVAFRFYRAMGDATPLCAPEVSVRDGMERDATTGSFSVEVPLRQSGHECPGTLFHDPNVLVEVAVGGTVVATRAPVNPVPYAHYASQYGTPDCPVGYERMADAAFTGEMRLCVRRRMDGEIYDEVVRVGAGATAFWIDRYEASAWQHNDGTGTQYGDEGIYDFPETFPPSGQTTISLYAVSLRGTIPATRATWFQANEACRASGKRLAEGDEWFAAGRGTSDPATDEEGADRSSRCLTSGRDLRRTGGHARVLGTVGCASDWGAEDMIGNVREWTGDWAVVGAQHIRGNISVMGASATADFQIPAQSATTPWGTGFGEDAVHGSAMRAWSGGTSGWADGLPAAIARGGGWADGTGAGIFAMLLDSGPNTSLANVGFRCVIPR